jgi:TP901 family phage tail tape measure protein
MALSAGEVEATLRLRDEMSAQFQQAQQNAKTFGDRIQQVATQTATASAGVVHAFKGIEGAVSAVISLPGTLRSMVLDPITSSLTSIGTKMTVGLTVPIVGFAAATLKASIDFEESFAGVLKTVDGLKDPMGRLTQDGKDMEQGFRNLAQRVPIAATELMNIGEIAGQLGVKKEGILKFTETIAQIAVTTDLTADAAATGLAQLGNIMQISTNDFDRLGSTLDRLGSESNATESGILEMSVRLAAAGKIAGLSAADVLGFSSALSSVGVEAEAGGTAFSKVFQDMFEAVQTGGGNLADFARVSGMTIGQFSKAFKTDAAGAVTSFVEGLHRIQKEGGNVFDVLRDVEFQDARLKRAILSAAEAGDQLRDSIHKGNEEWVANTYLQTEANTRFQTTGSTLKILWNRMVDISKVIGDSLKPALQFVLQIIDRLTPFVRGAADAFGKLPGPIQAVVLGAFAAAAAIGPLVLVLSSLVKTIALMSTLSTLNTLLGIFSGRTALAATSLGQFVGGLGPMAQGVIAGIDKTGALTNVLTGLVTWLRTGAIFVLEWVKGFFSFSNVMAYVEGAISGTLGLFETLIGYLVSLVGWPALIAAGFTVLALSFPGVRGALSDLLSVINSAVTILKFMAEDVIMTLVDGVKDAITWFLKWTGIADRLAPIMQAISNAINGATGFISKMASAMRELAEETEKADPKVRRVATWLAIAELFKTGNIGQAMAMYQSALLGLGAAAETAGDAAKGLKNPFNDLGSISDGLVAKIDPIGSGMAAAAKRAKEFKEDMEKLGVIGRQSIITQAAQGVGLEQLAKDFGVHEDSLKRLTKEHEHAASSGKKMAEALAALKGAEQGLSEAQMNGIRILKDKGLTEAQIAQLTGMSEAQVRLYGDAEELRKAKMERTTEAAQRQATAIVQAMTHERDVRRQNEAEIQKFEDEASALKAHGVQRSILLIEQERDNFIKALKQKEFASGDLYNKELNLAKAHYQHLIDVANHTFDTLHERMEQQGVFTRDDLKQTAADARTDYLQMKEDGGYSAQAVQEAWQRWYDADRAARGVMVTGWKKGLLDMAQMLVELGRTGTGVFASIAGGVGGVIAAIQAGAAAHQQLAQLRKQYQDGEASGAQVAMAYVQTIIAGYAQMAAATDNVSRAKAAIGGLQAGMETGMAIAGPWGAAIGGAVGFVVGLFRHNETRSVMKDVGKTWGTEISEGLAKSIAESEKKYHVSRSVAELLNISQIIDEAGGITTQNMGKFSAKASGLFSIIKQGGATGAKAMQELGATFTKLAEVAAPAGHIAGSALLNLVIQAKQVGVHVKEIDDFIKGQLQSASTALNDLVKANTDEQAKYFHDMVKFVLKDVDDKLIPGLTDSWEDWTSKFNHLSKEQRETFLKDVEGMRQTYQKDFTDMGVLTAATFTAMTASGMGYIEALNTLGPALDNLIDLQKKLGYAGDESFNELLHMRELVKANEPLMQQIEAMNRLMLGLGNAVGVNQKVFDTFASQAGAQFSKLKEVGFTTEEALQAMAPTLQTLYELQARFGFKVDETTQKLIDEAVKSGLVGKEHESAMDRVADSVQRIGDILATVFADKLPKALQLTADAAGRIGDRIRDIPDRDVHVHVHTDGDPDPGPHGTPPHHGKGGRFTRAHMAVVGDRPETIVPDAYLGDLAAAIASAGGAGGGGGDIVVHSTTVLDGRIIDERIERVSARAIKSGRSTVGTRNVKPRTY